jgi:hypothetical protein
LDAPVASRVTACGYGVARGGACAGALRLRQRPAGGLTARFLVHYTDPVQAPGKGLPVRACIILIPTIPRAPEFAAPGR